jgi:hypothetical protein
MPPDPLPQVETWVSGPSDLLALPRPNPYIPEDFDLVAQEHEPPSACPTPPALLRCSPTLQVLYLGLLRCILEGRCVLPRTPWPVSSKRCD